MTSWNTYALPGSCSGRRSYRSMDSGSCARRAAPQRHSWVCQRALHSAPHAPRCGCGRAPSTRSGCRPRRRCRIRAPSPLREAPARQRTAVACHAPSRRRPLRPRGAAPAPLVLPQAEAGVTRRRGKYASTPELSPGPSEHFVS
jgi:hypothetical protein